MEIRLLKGGTVITAEPVPVKQRVPSMRLGTPGTLFCDEASGTMLTECAKQQYGIPMVTHVRVIFREVEGIIYLVVAPVWVGQPEEATAAVQKQGSNLAPAADPPGELYALRNAPKHPTVYKLSRLVDAMKQPLRRTFWYLMESQIVKDEQLGLAVAGDFTHAKLEPRELPEKKTS